MSRSLAGTLALPLALLLTACPGDTTPDTEPAQEPVPGMPGSPAAVDPSAGPVDFGTQYLVRLSPVRAGGATGTLALTPAGDQTRVDVRIERVGAAGVYPGGIYSGDRCETPGSQIVELPPVTVGATGGGEGNGVLARPMVEVMDGNSIVIYRSPEAAGAEVVLCGGVPLMPRDVPGTSG
jgi:hypothetical protein